MSEPPDPRAGLIGERAGRSLNFDRVANEYDATRGGEERAARHAAAVSPHLDPTASVLEVGVGTGAVASWLRDAGFAVYGVDISPAMLHRARARLGQVVAAADATRLPLRSGSVAQALSVWVLHLVADVDAVAAEVARVLEPGGRWVVVPAGAHPAGDRDAISALTDDLEFRLRGGADGPRPGVDRMRSMAARAGLRLEKAVEGPAFTYSESPEEAASKLERRTFSLCWHLDDAAYEREVAPVVEALRALPDPQRPLVRRPIRELTVVLRSDP